MFRALIASILVGGGVLAACPAYAGAPPSGIGDAKLDTLRVLSSVAVTQRRVDLRGTWLDGRLGCDEYRSVRIGAILTYVSSNGAHKRRMTRGRVGVVRNCDEGRPNFGFRIRAVDTVPKPEGHHPHLGLACADGRWKRGSYTFTVRTLHRLTRLAATITVGWENEEAC